MKVAIWQTAASLRDPDGARLLATQAQEVAALGVELLVLPECFTSGYHVPDMAQVAQSADGAWARQVADVAREAGIAIVYGTPERAADGVFNVARLVNRSGEVIASHRKAHLYGELDRGMFRPSSGLSGVVDFEGLAVGLLICYDVEFPETVRALALAGADLVVVPTALMAPEDAIARLVVPTRALENQLFVAYANRVGREQELDYVGLSCVVAPDGTDLARAGSGDEVIIAEVSSSAVRAARAVYDQLPDRRPGLYGALVGP